MEHLAVIALRTAVSGSHRGGYRGGVLDFYFDFISPYAYLAWKNPRTGPRALAARHGIELALHPVLFAGLLERWGQLGPAESPAKRAFLVKDVMRHAAREGLPFTYPLHHPFNPLTLLRLALPAVSGARQAEVIDALFDVVWASGRDLADPGVIASALGPDGSRLLARTRDDDVKAALRAETDAAIGRDVFGVPTFIVRGELFWGSDRAADVEQFLAGNDPIDHALAQAIIARPVGTARR